LLPSEKAIRTFKMDHIVDVELTSEIYDTANFNATGTSSAWDIIPAIGPSPVKWSDCDCISSQVGRAVSDDPQLPSKPPQATVRDHAKKYAIPLFRLWIMRWEKDVEVIEPEILG
jgi:hypothetical protein